MNLHRLTIADVATAFGAICSSSSIYLQEKIKHLDLSYQKLENSERDHLILTILKQLDHNQFSQVGRHRQPIWQDVWTEHLQRFIDQNYVLDALTPKYINPNPIVRLKQEYVRPLSPKFELDLYEILRIWLFQTYLPTFPFVYEFGCGTGFNLAVLAQLFPEKELYGLDWSAASNQLVNLIAEKHSFNLCGYSFDFFNPELENTLKPGSAVLTMAALEQIGDRYEPFLNFLLNQSPARCIHLEPVLEFYDPDNLVDYLAIRYHQQRCYLSGYLTKLRQLEQDGIIKILQARRLGFGSLYHEAYSLIVWELVK